MKIVHEHRIHTATVYPPIPIRTFDWRATLDGYEPGDPIGEGETEIAAIADLLTKLKEIEDEQQEPETCSYCVPVKLPHHSAPNTITLRCRRPEAECDGEHDFTTIEGAVYGAPYLPERVQ